MKLVVDASAIFSALIKQNVPFELIRILPKIGWELYSPEFVFDEINEHKDRLLHFSELSEDELMFLIDLLFKKIKIIPKSKYSRFISESKSLLTVKGDLVDEKDVPYLALALSLNSAIWSDDKHFKIQSEVEVFTTKELTNLFFGSEL